MDRPDEIRPARRSERVISRPLGEEAVVYDLRTERVTCLDTDTAAVWQSCDGSHGVDELAELTGLDPDVVAVALARLDDADLLVAGTVSRRTLLRRVGISAALVPLISIAVPAAASAASGAPTIGTLAITQSTTMDCEPIPDNSFDGLCLFIDLDMTGWGPHTYYDVVLTWSPGPNGGTHSRTTTVYTDESANRLTTRKIAVAPDSAVTLQADVRLQGQTQTLYSTDSIHLDGCTASG